ILPTDFTPTLKFFYAFNIAPFLFHFSYATTFFLYILSARVYREELFRLISKVFHIRRPIQIQPMSTTHQRRHTEATRHQIPVIHE
ncbi:unnamed protein product, partial [Adineta steineri]